MTDNSTTLLSRLAELFDTHKLLIFFVPFFLYIFNGREISSGDPTPTVFVAVNLVKHGTVFLDDLHDYIPYHNMPYYISEQRGRIVSNYPVFPGIMSAPLFAPFVWMGMIEKGSGDLVWKYLSKLSGATYTALSILFLYLTIKRLLDRENALILAMAYGLGTALWPIAAQSLWQHGPSVFAWIWFLLAGFATGGAVLCRTVNGVGMAVLCAVITIRHRRAAVPFIVPAAILSSILIFYNIALFGSWKGGDTVLHSLHWELDRVQGGSWSTPLVVGLAGQLISPSRGIFIFSPFLLFSIWGMWMIWRRSESVWRTLAFTIPAPAIMLILFSKYAVWWGGNSHYGPRYQIETYPFLILYLSAIMPQIRRKGWLLLLFILLLLYSCIVQWIGAFCYPGGWETYPTDLANDKGRFWDWGYNQIWISARSGIKWPW